MEFLHGGVHRAFLRDLTRRPPVAGEVPPELFVVGCPRCGLEYFAHPLGELPPLRARAARMAARVAARTRLQEECPDHGHRFELRP